MVSGRSIYYPIFSAVAHVKEAVSFVSVIF